MRQFYALPEMEKLVAFFDMHDYLAARPGTNLPVAEELRERAAAITAIARVAQACGLPQGEAPKVADFNRTAKALGLGWTASKVGRRWQSYSNACDVYLGKRIPESPARSAARRATSGRRREYETPMGSIHRWLRSDAIGDSDRTDYAEWADEHNRGVIAGKLDEPLVLKVSAVETSLGIPFTAAVACARGETTFEVEAARRVRRELHRTGPLDLVGTHAVALILGAHVNAVSNYRRRPGFPTAVAYVSRKPAYLLADVEAYRDAGAAPDRTEGELQERVLDTAAVAARFGISADTVRTYIHQRQPAIPMPEGAVGQVHYWTQSGVDAWCTRNRSRRNRSDKRR